MNFLTVEIWGLPYSIIDFIISLYRIESIKLSDNFNQVTIPKLEGFRHQIELMIYQFLNVDVIVLNHNNSELDAASDSRGTAELTVLEKTAGHEPLPSSKQIS